MMQRQEVPRRLRAFLLWTGMILGMGCGTLPYFSVHNGRLPEKEWNDLQDRILDIQPGGQAHALHITVSDPDKGDQGQVIRIDIPIWMIHSSSSILTTFFRQADMENCDSTCRHVLQTQPWNLLWVPGTSVIIEDHEEKVLLWVD